MLVPQYNFITHNICMKTLNVYFHAVHFLNKPIMFLIKTRPKSKAVSVLSTFSVTTVMFSNHFSVVYADIH